MKLIITLLLSVSAISTIKAGTINNNTKQDYYSIWVYHFTSTEQENLIDDYLQNALIPALHKMQFKKVGVFKPLTNDTAADKTIYLIIAGQQLQALTDIETPLKANVAYQQAGAAFLNAAYDKPPFTRYERILLKAFPLAPQMKMPALTTAGSERIYELRSYESPTQSLYHNKVKMFNQGDEIGLFARLGFNAVFYADVISGSRMPNLMYMTCFENRAARDEHWKQFVADPQWKNLVADPQYQHNVSKADIILLKAAPYSDY